MITSAAAAEGEHPIDVHYRRLKSDMTWVDRFQTSSNDQRLRQNTHGSTHTTYNLDLWT